MLLQHSAKQQETVLCIRPVWATLSFLSQELGASEYAVGGATA